MIQSARLRRKLLDYLTSPLNVNAAYLFGATGMSAAAGFVFWLLAARFTNPSALGITSSMIASVNLLKGIADFGLGASIIYYGAKNERQMGRLVNTVVAANLILSSVLVSVFILGLPLWSPGLMLIRSTPGILVFFLIFAVIDSLLSVQDNAMLSRSKANYVFWRTVACNVPSFLLLPLVTQFTRQFSGLFLAYALPNMIVIGVSSLLIMPGEFGGYRKLGRIDLATLRQIFRYSSAVQAGNILWAIPNYALPLMVINLLSPEIAGYFAINWAIINFVLIIPRVVSTSMFVEGVHRQDRLWKTVRQALFLVLITVSPAILALWFLGSLIISIFGQDYVNQTLLHILLIGTIPFSIDTIYFSILRVEGRLKAIVIFAALIAGTIMGSAALLVDSMSVRGIAAGWLLGYAVPAVYVAGILARKLYGTGRAASVLPTRMVE